MFKRGDIYWTSIKGIRQSLETKDKELAKAREGELRKQQYLQDHFGVKPPKSWKEAALRWLQEKAHKRSIDDDIAKLRWLDGHLGAVRDIGRISRDQVHQIMLIRGDVRPNERCAANSTANRYVALVSGILHAAERSWEWGNRAPKLRTYPEPEKGGRWLTAEEWRALEAQLPSHLRMAATFALCTGLREAKVFGLKWSAVNLRERSLFTNGSENKLGVHIPMNAASMSILAKCRSAQIVSPEHVFLYQGKPMKEHGQASWRKAFERAGVEYMKWHGLRHTFISWLAQEGVPQEVRKRLAGHKTNEVHDRYTHLQNRHLLRYSRVIDFLLAGDRDGLKALKRSWFTDEEVEDIHITGTANRIIALKNSLND